MLHRWSYALTNPLTQVITVAEAVELSGFNIRKVQRYCKSGLITSRQYLNGSWLILKSSVPTKEVIKNENYL